MREGVSDTKKKHSFFASFSSISVLLNATVPSSSCFLERLSSLLHLFLPLSVILLLLDFFSLFCFSFLTIGISSRCCCCCCSVAITDLTLSSEGSLLRLLNLWPMALLALWERSFSLAVTCWFSPWLHLKTTTTSHVENTFLDLSLRVLDLSLKDPPLDRLSCLC